MKFASIFKIIVEIFRLLRVIIRVHKFGSMENDGTANAGTGNCRYWKMPVLENDGTGK